ncbi:MAG: ATP-binding protein [Pseudomonadota bacterium]
MAHILVVDDRPANRQLIVTLLGYYGHAVEESSDGAAALLQIAKRRPDLVITDLLMPNMDGEAFCRRLRSDPDTAAIPIVIHTASYRASQARRIADRVGVRWVLPKPSEPMAILEVITEALGLELPVAAGTQEPSARPAPAGADALSANPLEAMKQANRRLADLLADAARIARIQGKVLAQTSGAQRSRLLAMRFSTLVSAGLHMARQTDPDALVDLACAAIQDILSARYVGVVILAPQGGLRKFASRGLDRATQEAVALEIEHCPAARRVLASGSEPSMLVAARGTDFIGLPPSHPTVHTLLACPVSARDTTSGWVYAADRLGSEEFDPDEERLLFALVAQLAGAWSSLMVVDELDRRVAARTRELEAANDELKAFSAVVSHDLRAPLGKIDGFAKALRHKAGDALPPDALRYLDRIEGNAQLMARLIDDLLHFARTSHQPLQIRRVDLDRLARACIRSFEAEIAQRHVSVLVGELGEWHVDDALIAQVLLNLVGNALKYSRKQEHPVIEIGARVVNAEKLLFVRDNGTGFDMADASSLFRPFERLHNASEFEGTGIGLALVKQIVARHGGRVWAEGKRGDGACFFVALPRRDDGP